MDVKFEGENVVRHLDLTTHNHASAPGNTPPWGYMDTMGISVDGQDDPCKSQREKVEKACGKCEQQHKRTSGKKKDTYIKSRLKECMCKDKDCNKARKCVLVPYKDGCCDGKTPHHVVPKHCFRQTPKEGALPYAGCDDYQPGDAPCVCVTGEDKSNKRKQHARIHKEMDKAEDDFKAAGGTWTYKQAADAGAKSVNKVLGCNEKCTKAQLDKYHQGKPPNGAGIQDGTSLRADSAGTSPSSPKLKTAKGAF